jgi:hypothetical protein
MHSQLGLGLRMSNVGVLRNGLVLKRKPIKCRLYQDITVRCSEAEVEKAEKGVSPDNLS